MRTVIIILFFSTVWASCVHHYYNDDGGVRVANSKVFKYNKPRYTSRNKLPIDTNAIYVLDSSYNKYDVVMGKKKPPASYVRFFSTGQVQFFYDTTKALKQLNNRNIGVQGYYIIKGDKIKIDMFQEINGGQTGKYFGKVLPDNNLMFYEQRPETCFGSFSCLERDGRKSFWKKAIVPHMEHYKPDW